MNTESRIDKELSDKEIEVEIRDLTPILLRLNRGSLTFKSRLTTQFCL